MHLTYDTINYKQQSKQTLYLNFIKGFEFNFQNTTFSFSRMTLPSSNLNLMGSIYILNTLKQKQKAFLLTQGFRN